ncbi:5-formyltetrahydrofolate cyclo-ligase [Candidatus Spongiihabitans sp.]|uniref:5-formyltetrahydrofolate cyclo-ligase n=1 Tax=Candidatus Spongiihabitans sp. TaxID=3101308 RepID=UPI003C7B834D
MSDSRHKAALRGAMRARRRSLSADQQAVAARGLLAQLQSVAAFLEATKIALYLAHDGEIDPIEAMKWCWHNSKQACLPIVQAGKNRPNNTLVFANVNEQTEYAENRFSISEPVVEQDQMIQAQSLDLVLMPLVAFDQNGNRLGMGGGFYDTTFAFLTEKSTDKPRLIGIAHEIQKVDTISAEHWDIPLTTVVTDKNIYNLGMNESMP